MSTRHFLIAIVIRLAWCVTASAWLAIAIGCSKEPESKTENGEQLGKQPAPKAIGARFTNIAKESGLTHSFSNTSTATQPTLLETLGGGAGLLDFDRDGLLDVFLAGGGSIGEGTVTGNTAVLFHQGIPLEFEEVTQSARVDTSAFFSHGVATADFDNDGFTDVLVTGWRGMALFQNQGDGTFLKCGDETGIGSLPWSNSAAWGDVNGDGHLDVYITQYLDWSFEKNPACRDSREGRPEVCSPRDFHGMPDHLFLNGGDGTFRDMSTEWNVPRDGKGLGVIMSDVDLDGDTDVYVANDTTPNFLLRNESNSRFEEVGLLSGSGLSGQGSSTGSMGVAIADVDSDGAPEIWVTNYEQESSVLYRNLGRGAFLDNSRIVGLDAETGPSVGWGTAIEDFDSDGDADIIVTNGHPNRFPVNGTKPQRPHLLANSDGRFVDTASSAGRYFSTVRNGRGLVVGDVDDDGRADVLVTHLDEPVALLRNENEPSRKWLRLRLVGTQSNRDSTGSVVQVSSGDHEQTLLWNGGGSFLSTHSQIRVVVLPEGQDTAALEVRWPSGVIQKVTASNVQPEVVIIEAKQQDNR